jgi:hypothetical protein
MLKKFLAPYPITNALLIGAILFCTAPLFILLAGRIAGSSQLQVGGAVILYLVGLALGIVSIALNRRTVFQTVVYLGLGACFIYLMTIRDAYPALQQFRLFNNLFIVTMALYIPAHLVIHTIAYAIDRKRKIITKSGVLQGALSLAIIFTMYITTFILKDTINLFYYWYNL